MHAQFEQITESQQDNFEKVIASIDKYHAACNKG
jgi:hypothetical protein